MPLPWFPILPHMAHHVPPELAAGLNRSGVSFVFIGVIGSPSPDPKRSLHLRHNHLGLACNLLALSIQ